MSTYRAPYNDFKHIIEMLSYNHSEFDRELCMDILSQIGSVVEKDVHQSNYDAEEIGLKYDAKGCNVQVPETFKHIYKLLKEQGVTLLPLPKAYGGSEAPWVLMNMVSEMLCSGNIAMSTCHMLTHGAIEVIESSASDTLKQTYLPKMAAGDFSGTMCLTEPHCGTDLGLIKTKAVKQGDYFLLSGQKIWITFGEHDMTENIIHLVLGRVEGAPEGIKGISLFLVPKFMPDGSRNNVKCIGLEEKMGQHCSPTCVMKFDGAVAYMVGELNKGMRAMFKMMNPARIGVGVQGLSSSELAYQIAREFVMTRRQSRSLDVKKREMTEYADLIWVHPDVRRMLVSVRASNFGMRMLVAQISQWLDEGNDDLVALLTPIVKSFCTDMGVENISVCQQILGGSGYVKDYHIEKIYRDARITTVYEGTNGIQALDLLGRKIAKDGGAVLKGYITWMQGVAHKADDFERDIINKSINDLHDANTYLIKNIADPEMIGFIAVDYLNYLGHLSVMVMYAKMSMSCDTYKPLSQFYGNYMMPRASTHLKRIMHGKGNIMDDWSGIV